MTGEIVLATSNEEKYRMIKDVFGDEIDLERRDADVFEVQSLDRETVVKEKARSAYEEIGSPVIVDDFSFYFEDLGRFPGPLIKHLLKETGVDGLKALDDRAGEKCRTVCSVAYYDGDELVKVEGQLRGVLDFEEVDPDAPMVLMTAFIPEGFDSKLGELDIDNHRHKAYRDLKEKLDLAH